MIDYKLAKKLKEAGFPQGNSEFALVDEYGDGRYWTKVLKAGYEHSQGGYKDCQEIDAPTLSELIKECGEDFNLWNLRYKGGISWQAEDDRKDEIGKGSSPEEAVANLYLELCKQQKSTE